VQAATLGPRERIQSSGAALIESTAEQLRRLHGPGSALARYRTTSSMVLTLLAAFLVLLVVVFLH
jgi:hypothetical protein